MRLTQGGLSVGPALAYRSATSTDTLKGARVRLSLSHEQSAPDKQVCEATAAQDEVDVLEGAVGDQGHCDDESDDGPPDQPTAAIGRDALGDGRTVNVAEQDPLEDGNGDEKERKGNRTGNDRDEQAFFNRRWGCTSAPEDVATVVTTMREASA
ncbi:MAG: hypothetical protein U1E62_16115 [Alsobacter sp.]